MAIRPARKTHPGVIRIVSDGKSLMKIALIRKLSPMPATGSADAEQRRFAENDPNDISLRRAEGLQDADFARAFDDGGVHREKNHQEADGHRDADHNVDEGAQNRADSRRSSAK